MKPVNRDRDGASVEEVTVVGNKADALRLLGWLKSERHVAPSLCGVFGSDRLGAAVQQFVDNLVRIGRTYSTIAGYITSFVALAQFVHAVRVARAAPGATVSNAPVEAMKRILKQAMQQARLEGKFSKKPISWLDWDQVQTARARAVRQYEHSEGEGSAKEQRNRLFDATLLTWLTSVPPDRVGVTRLLRVGGTLKPTANGGFDLDLSTRNAHKTAAAFGPSLTAVPTQATELLTAWLRLTGLSAASKPYVFVLGASDATGHGVPVASSAWTKVVQAAFKRHLGVALAPKELRSSYITWLRSGEHSEDALRRAPERVVRV